MKFFLLAACFMATAALAEDVEKPAAELPSKNLMHTLGKVDAEAADDTTSINVRFSEDLNWESVSLSDHGTFIQLDMPETIVPTPGDFFDGAGPFLKKMAVFQITPQTGALRLFFSFDAMLVKQSLKADILGDRILITIDHKQLNSLIANDPKVTATPSTAKSAEEVIASTKVDTELPNPASLIQASASSSVTAEDKNNTQESSSTESAAILPKAEGLAFDFQDKLVHVALFCGILLLGMMSFMVVGPRIRKAHKAIIGSSETTLRSLASHTVAPKQKIELIDVAGQQVLIGVTPGNINFLTMIQPKDNSMQVIQQQVPPRQVTSPRPKQLPEQTPRVQTHTKPSQKVQSKIPSNYTKKSAHQNDAINDVTKLIREKLKNIPSV